jgi:hypothetical protein
MAAGRVRGIESLLGRKGGDIGEFLSSMGDVRADDGIGSRSRSFTNPIGMRRYDLWRGVLVKGRRGGKRGFMDRF